MMKRGAEKSAPFLFIIGSRSSVSPANIPRLISSEILSDCIPVKTKFAGCGFVTISGCKKGQTLFPDIIGNTAPLLF